MIYMVVYSLVCVSACVSICAHPSSHMFATTLLNPNHKGINNNTNNGRVTHLPFNDLCMCCKIRQCLGNKMVPSMFFLEVANLRFDMNEAHFVGTSVYFSF